MFHFGLCFILLSVFCSACSSKLQPVPVAIKSGDLLGGIELICPEQRSSNLLVLTYDASSIPDEVSPLLLAREYPLLVQNDEFTGKKQPWFTKCIIGLFASVADFKRASSRFPYSTTLILVVPSSQREAFLKLAPTVRTCLLYIYHYDPVGWSGSWLIVHPSGRQYSMAAFESFTGDMQGYGIYYLNTDYMRDDTYDRAIGQTIATRHNGSFVTQWTERPDQCVDYYYNVMFQANAHFIVLPDESALCFIVPRSSLKSVFWVLLDPYDLFSWIVFGVMVCVVSLVLACFGESAHRFGLLLVALELLMTAINGPTHRFDGAFEKRVIGLFLLACIVLISGYQSLVISFMSVPRFEPELDTIELINDTCVFQYNAHLASLSYNFKNFVKHFVEGETMEKAWRRKMCSMLPCSEVLVVNVDADGEVSERLEGLGAYSKEELELVKLQMRYFRYSKARLHAQSGLYQVLFDSPVRQLVERYTTAFVEGQLHHYPVLRKKKTSAREYSPHNPLALGMNQNSLQIIWMIYGVGMGAAMVCFLVELCVLCGRKMKSMHWRRPRLMLGVRRQIKTIR